MTIKLIIFKIFRRRSNKDNEEVRELQVCLCSKADAYKIIVSKSQMIKVPITLKY